MWVQFHDIAGVSWPVACRLIPRCSSTKFQLRDGSPTGKLLLQPSLGVFLFVINSGGHKNSSFLSILTSCRFWVFYYIFSSWSFSLFHPSSACRHFHLSMKVQLVMRGAVMTYHVMVGTHFHFLSWLTSSDKATGLVFSDFWRCILRVTYDKFEISAQSICVSPPLAPGFRDEDTCEDVMRPSSSVIPTRRTVHISFVLGNSRMRDA